MVNLKEFVNLFRCTKCHSEKGLELKKDFLECRACKKKFKIEKEHVVFS